MANVEIRNVHKAYGSVETIKGVSIDAPDGEFVVLVGPSGCGKSTLLRMIAGLEEIDAGVISIGGRVINQVEPKHRDIAMVFQNYALYPHMTVAVNMAFSLRLARTPKAEIRQRVEEAARILGLSDYLERYPKQLSGGQRQRVAMGRAIVRNPQVYLFDEPLSNLDAKLRVQMRAELKAIHARLKTTTIYVTHDQIEAMTMANTIVVMRDGIVEQSGAPLDLYDHPSNTFVAGFIGSPAMNLMEAQSDGVDGAVKIAGENIVRHGVQGVAKGKVICGIRPEHLAVVEPSADGIDVVITNLEPTGSDTLVQAQLGGQLITAQLRERIAASPGDTIRLGSAAENVHLFDPSAQRRLGGSD
ncbi:MAG: sn-glycerol-3-phosphate ABC transporter ATP-binding protein UgpC [Pseudomonadota bacterium]